MLSFWPNLLFLFISYYFLFTTIFHESVVWGWSLRTDSVDALSQPCTVDSFLIIMTIM